MSRFIAMSAPGLTLMPNRLSVSEQVQTTPPSAKHKSGGWTVFKEVLFLLVETDSTKVGKNNRVKAHDWLDFHRAFTKLQHLGARDILRKAYTHMEKMKKT